MTNKRAKPMKPVNETMEPVDTYRYVPQRLIDTGPKPRWESIHNMGSTLDYVKGLCQAEERHGYQTRILIMRTRITYEVAE